MATDKSFHIDTIAAQIGKHFSDDFNTVAPPVVLSSSYLRNAEGDLRGPHMYSRLSNPNRVALEQGIALLEGGAACAAFASGSAATSAVYQALRPGDHVLMPNEVYYGTFKQLEELVVPWGIEVSRVDMTDTAAVRAALHSNTKLVWVESPSNPSLRITDLQAVSDIAHAAGAIVVADNTLATPVLCRPLQFGCDLVVHSTSKYFGGHSDVVGGAVVARSDTALFRRIRQIQQFAGAVPSPFDCWLVLRGIRTLPLRVRAQSASAQVVAEYLDAHPEVHTVHYPGLPTHPAAKLIAKQMSQPGAMLSFQVRGGREAARKVAGGAKVYTCATSLGGVESLIEHRAAVEQFRTAIPDDLLRLSIGLENPQDLIADLRQALAP